jgi:hypothetical protein
MEGVEAAGSTNTDHKGQTTLRGGPRASESAFVPETWLLRLLEHAPFRDYHDDAIIRHMVFLAVFFQVVTDFRVLRQIDMPVNNRPADAGIPSDIDVREEDGAFNVRIAVDANVR